MKFATIASALALATAGVLLAGHAEARDQIRIVGSSTVYPFTTTVAEQFGKTSGMKTPVVEFDRHRRRHEAVLRRRRRRSSGRHQRVARHEEERVR